MTATEIFICKVKIQWQHEYLCKQTCSFNLRYFGDVKRKCFLKEKNARFSLKRNKSKIVSKGWCIILSLIYEI